MARAVLGKRIRINNEDLRGVFISGLDTSSGAGTDASPYASANVVATNASGQLEPTTFDSGAHVGGGYQPFFWDQGTFLQSGDYSDMEMETTVTHNWGRDTYGVGNTGTQRPLFAFRWTPSSELVAGLAQKTYPPVNYYRVFEGEYDEEEDTESSEEEFFRVEAVHLNANQIKIHFDAYGGGDIEGSGMNSIAWALLVFYEDDFNGGKSV